MYQLSDELFEEIKLSIENLIKSCSDPERSTLSTSEFLDSTLDVYSIFLKIKDEH